MKMENLKCGKHSLTFEDKYQRIAVRTKIDRNGGFVSHYSYAEYDQALACFKRLTADSKIEIIVIK